MSMRKVTIIVMTLHIISTSAMADKANGIHEIRRLLEQVVTITPHIQEGAFGGVSGVPKSPEFEQLKASVIKHRKEVLDNLEALIAPSKGHQILFIALCYLPQQDSFQGLNKMADLCLDNTVSQEVFSKVILHYEERMKPRHRLALNYKNPVVVEVLRKAKLIHPEMSAYYEKKASGEASKEITSFWYEDPDLPTPFRIIFVVFWLPILVGVSILIAGIVMAWRYFRKKETAGK